MGLGAWVLRCYTSANVSILECQAVKGDQFPAWRLRASASISMQAVCTRAVSRGAVLLQDRGGAGGGGHPGRAAGGGDHLPGPGHAQDGQAERHCAQVRPHTLLHSCVYVLGTPLTSAATLPLVMYRVPVITLQACKCGSQHRVASPPLLSCHLRAASSRTNDEAKSPHHCCAACHLWRRWAAPQ